MNKHEFLDAIVGKSVTCDIEGLQISIRSLTVMELQEISKLVTDEFEATLMTVIFGLVEPKLDKEDLAGLKYAKPGLIMKIAKEIRELSGLTENPTAGNG
jgi:hypothetical protein